MKHNLVMGLALVSISMVCSSAASEPAYREIQFSVTYGVVIPEGVVESMESGSGFAFDLGVVLSPRFVAGFRGSVDSLKPIFEDDALGQQLYGDNNWMRYTASGYGEFIFSHRRLSPFIGANLGLQGWEISYAPSSCQYFASHGNWGLGLGFSVGIRYRHSNRFGGVVRLDAENATGIGREWFYAIRGGVSFFM